MGNFASISQKIYNTNVEYTECKTQHVFIYLRQLEFHLTNILTKHHAGLKYVVYSTSTGIASLSFRPIKKIWHGSLAGGEVNIQGLNCDNWRTSSSDATATAASIMSYTPALNEEVVKCNNELIVLCIQSKLS